MWWKNLLFLTGILAAGAATLASLHPRNRLLADAQTPPPAWNETDYAGVVARLNEEFRADWAAEQLQAAPRADDLTIARRLGLALAGTVPSLEEIRALEAQPASHRLGWWLDRLLADRRTSDYLAERLARAYVGAEDGPFLVFRRRRFGTWLSDELQKNRGYHQIAGAMLSSTGLWTSVPETNFVTATVVDDKPDPERLAGRTARALLGLRIDCLQCHDDRLGNSALGDDGALREGRQQDFHQLAAFFSGTELSLAGVRDVAREYRYQYLDADAPTTVSPKTPYLAPALPSEGLPRARLAAWITHPENRPFARAAVNRFWAILFGRPLVEPIDDIPLAGPYPPGLEILAGDFAQHGYDVHRLLRIIVTSEAFCRDSRAEFPITDQHEAHWAAFPLTRLRPEQVAGGLLQACSVKTQDAHAHILLQLARYGQLQDFVKRFGDKGEDEFEDRGGTIPQRLLMMNGGVVAENLVENPIINATTHLAMFARDDTTAIENACLAVLTRRPTRAEQACFLDRLQGRQGSERQQALEDLYWVLLNSTEFTWNH